MLTPPDQPTTLDLAKQYSDARLEERSRHYDQIIVERDKVLNLHFSQIEDRLGEIHEEIKRLHGSTHTLTAGMVTEDRYQIDINGLYNRIVVLETFMNESKGREKANVTVLSIFGLVIIVINVGIDLVLRLVAH